MKHTPIPHRRPRVSSSGSYSDTPHRKKNKALKKREYGRTNKKEVNLKDLYTSIYVGMKSSKDRVKRDQNSLQNIEKSYLLS